ncbi:MAG: glycerol acyltransferase [Kofleriaceae bacterium]|nr:glycerol acyltransferase [Kofleriaceae bacterium]
MLRWLHRDSGVPDGASDPGRYDPTAVAQILRFAGRFIGPGRYFRLDVRGLEHVPPRPSMVVSNHSGGTTIPDVWGFAYAWYRHFGASRPIHPLAHEIVTSTRTTARFFGRLGVLRAGRGVARDVLTGWGRDLMVMPGGDIDTWRPWRERYQVRFGGRTGYARTAILAGAPIVPVANAGAHDTLMVLSDGQRLARWLRLPELTRATVWPVHLSLPWGLAIGPLPHLPLPTTLRYRVGAPIAPPPLHPGEEPTDEMVGDLDAAVRAAVQGLLDGLRAEAYRRRGPLGARRDPRAVAAATAATAAAVVAGGPRVATAVPAHLDAADAAAPLEAAS